MDMILQLIAWATANGPQMIAAVNAVVLAMIALALLIPGPQPEGWLQSIANFLSKFSKK